MEIRFFAPGNLVSNLDFVESIFGNARRSVPAGKRRRAGCRTLDRPHRLRHSRAASGQGHQKSPRPAALGTRPPNASAATGCAGKTRTNSTTTAAPSKSPRATNAASSSRSSRTIISATAKKRSRRRSATRPTSTACARKNTPAARWFFPATIWARNFMRTNTCAPAAIPSRKSCNWPGGDGIAAGRLRDRQEISGHHLRAARRSL